MIILNSSKDLLMIRLGEKQRNDVCEKIFVPNLFGLLLPA